MVPTPVHPVRFSYPVLAGLPAFGFQLPGSHFLRDFGCLSFPILMRDQWPQASSPHTVAGAAVLAQSFDQLHIPFSPIYMGTSII